MKKVQYCDYCKVELEGYCEFGYSYCPYCGEELCDQTEDLLDNALLIDFHPNLGYEEDICHPDDEFDPTYNPGNYEDNDD